MSWKLSPAMQIEMCRLYEEGWSQALLSRQFGVSQGHVSKILKQRGVLARPFRTASRFDADAVKICEGCGAKFSRGVTRTGREEKAWRFAQRRFCSKECRSTQIGTKNKERFDEAAWTIGKRTLIAKTCPSCRELLPASRFQRQRRGYYATNCGRCVQNNWFAALNEERQNEIQQCSRVQVKRANDDSRTTARRHGQLWTGPELELLERKDLSVPQLAAMLGRTQHAVRTQQKHLKRGDPVKTLIAGVS